MMLTLLHMVFLNSCPCICCFFYPGTQLYLQHARGRAPRLIVLTGGGRSTGWPFPRPLTARARAQEASALFGTIEDFMWFKLALVRPPPEAGGGRGQPLLAHGPPPARSDAYAACALVVHALYMVRVRVCRNFFRNRPASTNRPAAPPAAVARPARLRA
jgi:hypothetical protein